MPEAPLNECALRAHPLIDLEMTDALEGFLLVGKSKVFLERTLRFLALDKINLPVIHSYVENV